MVCPRCIDAVGHIFEQLNLKPISIKLGEVTLDDLITIEQKNKLATILSSKGFEVWQP